MQDKPVALVTGDNKGIGLQIAKDLAAHGFTVLVNNAGISHLGQPGRPLEKVRKSGRPSVASLDEVRAVFETNVFGVVIAVTQAMLPLLREASAARIVNVSSGSGSLTLNADPTNSHREMFGAVYSPSKTALNAITLAFAIELESTSIKSRALTHRDMCRQPEGVNAFPISLRSVLSHGICKTWTQRLRGFKIKPWNHELRST